MEEEENWTVKEELGLCMEETVRSVEENVKSR